MLGFAVRVHPLFFVLPFVMGAQSAGATDNPGVVILIFTIAFFVSILVHELGHSIAMRFFGVPSRIVLYVMGGLAIPESGGWGGGGKRLNSQQQIIVSLAGPVAGFLLAALTVGIIFALGGSVAFGWNGIFPRLFALMEGTSIEDNQSLVLLLDIMLFCTIVWNVLNLAPVIPLDGGQICREICLQADYQNGLRTALMISLFAGVIIGLMGFVVGDRFAGFIFLLLAYSSYMSLQRMSGRGGGVW